MAPAPDFAEARFAGLGRHRNITMERDDQAVIRRLPELLDAHIEQLAAVLIDCVEGGASVSFMHPLTRQKASDFWRRLAPDVADGRRLLLAAHDTTGIVGTVQVILDQPENQPHRADVAKMLVHRRSRRRGIGSALMRAAEESARSAGKTLLVLDTASGDAERLYARLGWIRAGTVPDYALWPHGGLCSTSFYYRRLELTAWKIRSSERRHLLQHHQRQPKAAVVDAQVAGEFIPNDGFGVNESNLLRDDTDIGGVTPQIPVAVNPEPIAANADQGDVALEPRV